MIAAIIFTQLEMNKHDVRKQLEISSSKVLRNFESESVRISNPFLARKF
jgi:hypothetical protein